MDKKTTLRDSVSIVVPAYNEERAISATVEGITKTVGGVIADYEIIIVDDGSTDKTGEIAEALSKKDKRIRAWHHRHNEGFGKAFRDGIRLATKSYLTGIPGDNDTDPKLIVDVYQKRHEADLVSTYPGNKEARALARQLLSDTYITLMNLLFGLHLKYYTGYFLCKTKTLKELELHANGFSIFAEIKVLIMRRGATIVEIPFIHIKRHYGRSKAVTIKSISQVFVDTLRFIWALYV